MGRRLALVVVVVALTLLTAARASALTILDSDHALNGYTAVAKSSSKGYRSIGFEIRPIFDEKVGYSWYINCPKRNWRRAKHGTVTASSKGVRWIVQPPPWVRCNEVMKGWLVDNTGKVYVEIQGLIPA